MSDSGCSIVVHSFGSRAEADFAKSALEAAGIDALVAAMTRGGLRPHMTFVNGAELLVRAEDVAGGARRARSAGHSPDCRGPERVEGRVTDYDSIADRFDARYGRLPLRRRPRDAPEFPRRRAGRRARGRLRHRAIGSPRSARQASHERLRRHRSVELADARARRAARRGAGARGWSGRAPKICRGATRPSIASSASTRSITSPIGTASSRKRAACSSRAAGC